MRNHAAYPLSRDSWSPRRRVPPRKSATLSRGDRVAAQDRALSRPNVWPCHVCFWPFCQKLKTEREVPQTSSPRSISSINSNAFSKLPLRLQRKLHWNSATRHRVGISPSHLPSILGRSAVPSPTHFPSHLEPPLTSTVPTSSSSSGRTSPTSTQRWRLCTRVA